MIAKDRKLPRIIQGGMGIAVSNWRLASQVAQLGEMGVVSGTAIDSVVVRELQLGDPYGRLEVLADYPDQEIVAHLKKTFYIEGGKKADAAYRLLPIHSFKANVKSQRILCAATFSEIVLAKRGHNGLVGINLLTKLKRHSLACLYGSILAGVDAVLMGAGIPIEEAEALRLLAEGKPAKIRLEVDAPKEAPTFHFELNPADLNHNLTPLPAPDFYPIISSDVLAGILHKKLPSGTIAGYIVEGPIAGGHNAPPRNKGVDEDHNPVYDDRDVASIERIAALGYPFYLAGGYGNPRGLQEALALGAAGVQVGSLFSLTDESGYPAETKTRIIESIHRRQARVRTDGRVSSTGFPFKVLEIEGTLGMPGNLQERKRICDLGYLQTAYLDDKGHLQGRCSAEPVDTYLKKGGREEDTYRRGCLCNGLLSNIGLAQVQKWGEESQLLTAGDELINLPLGSIEHPHFSAADVIDYLYGR